MNPSNFEIVMLFIASCAVMWLAVKLLLIACEDNSKHIEGTFSTDWGRK